MNVAKLMQQAQQAQAEMQRVLGELEVEGSSGGGLVKVRINGLKELLGVKIDGEALRDEEVSLLEDLIVAAWEDASRQVQGRIQEVLSGMGLPPGLQGML